MSHRETPFEQPFVRWAHWYDELYASRGRAPEREVAAIKHNFEWISMDAARLRILDVGCGTGVHWPALSEFGEVVGIDRCPEMLAVAKARYPQGNWRLGELRDMRVSGKFDAVTMLFAVCAYANSNDEARALLQSAASHLMPGGALVVSIEFVRETLRPPEARSARVVRAGVTLVRDSHAVVRRSPDGSEHLVTTLTFRNAAGEPLWQEEHRHLIASRDAWKDWLSKALEVGGARSCLHVRQS